MSRSIFTTYGLIVARQPPCTLLHKDKDVNDLDFVYTET